MSKIYYNEIDPFCCEWLQALMDDGHIPYGDIDNRSIEDVKPSEIKDYVQCHFFAGIGGWSYALRLAGWPDDRPVWTGSCPCQPFSSAGQGKGFDDERHLWPAFMWHIKQCKPVVVFGEQVAGRHGEIWIDSVSTELEAENYTVGATVIGACGVGAPHIRKRLYWVADSRCKQARASEIRSCVWSKSSGTKREPSTEGNRPSNSGKTMWDGSGWITGMDGVKRPIEPGINPLVDGFPGRVEQLRGYGNAIVPQLAAQFIEAFSCQKTPHTTQSRAQETMKLMPLLVSSISRRRQIKKHSRRFSACLLLFC
jgi:DNA (cytosine-5)-methyltransferase 1